MPSRRTLNYEQELRVVQALVDLDVSVKGLANRFDVSMDTIYKTGKKYGYSRTKAGVIKTGLQNPS